MDPDRPEEFRAWFDAGDAGQSAGRIDPYETSYAEWVHAVGAASSAERFEAVGAFRDGACVGAAAIILPLLDNTQLAIFLVLVPPSQRRRGVGGALVEHLGSLARAEGRRTWYAQVRLPAGAEETADTRFATRHGFTLRNTQIRRQARLPLPAEQMAELEAYAAERADGYRVVSWSGACPQEYVEQYAYLRGLISTEAPSGDLNVEQSRWDVARQRENEERTTAQGRRIYVSAAVAPDGTLAGHTRIYVAGQAPQRAVQGGTLVLRDHRGHRLGLAVKLANLRALLAAEPEVNRIDTENAEQNAPMVAVNVRLGFEIVENMREYQRDVQML